LSTDDDFDEFDDDLSLVTNEIIDCVNNLSQKQKFSFFLSFLFFFFLNFSNNKSFISLLSPKPEKPIQRVPKNNLADQLKSVGKQLPKYQIPMEQKMSQNFQPSKIFFILF